jgi:gamma-glutamyltranspeptidase / glutathione hydrolase
VSGTPAGGTDPVFTSRRSPVAARGGMTASSQPLASRAGLRALEDGGTAADAAVVMAAVLNLTEPCSTGIGGDCFALYFEAATGRVTALNGSGRAAGALTIDLVRRQGLAREDADGARFADPCHAHAATVPGACAGWCDLLARHGTFGIAEALTPAIRLAEEGFPVAPLTSFHWSRGAEGVLARASGGRALTIGGRGPRPGEVFRNPGLARTFREVAEGGADAFYRGTVARDIAEAVQRSGGVMSPDDLAAHRSTWDEPISVGYRGVRVWECPPNGQGLAALIALGILDGLDLAALPGLSAERWHLVVEAVRLAFADAIAFVADPSASDVPVAGLLCAEYLAGRRALIDRSRASPRVDAGAPRGPRVQPPAGGTDTVYFCAVDGRGNACSFINSNYMGFGTGIVPAGRRGPWGFTLQNRGANFSLDPSHPNALAPGKRPYHTIIPGMITRADGSLLGPFGVMGGFMQPQGHVQVAVGLLVDALDPQAALDRPRFFADLCPGMAGTLHLEDGLPRSLPDELTARGHRVAAGVSGHARAMFGRGQVIERRPDGVLVAGSDPRADGCAMGF